MKLNKGLLVLAAGLGLAAIYAARAEVYSCEDRASDACNVVQFLGLDGKAQSVDASHPLPVTGATAGGADVTEGAIGDTQANGTVVGYLKSLWSIFNANPPATSANQTTGNTNTADTATGIGAPADSAYSSGSGSIIAILKGLYAQLVSTQAAITAAGCPSPCAVVGSGFDVVTAPTIGGSAEVAGKSVGGLQTVSVAAATNGTITLNGLTWISHGGFTTPMVALIYNGAPAGTCTDNSTVTMVSGDEVKLVAAINFTPTTVPNLTQAEYELNNFGKKIVITNSTKNIYVCFMANGSYTPPAGDVNFRVHGDNG